MLRGQLDPLQKTHLDAAQDLLTRAFDDDPYFHFLYAPPRRAAMIGGVMRSSVELALSAGQARGVLDPDLQGVCLWWRPGTHPPSDMATVRFRGAAIARAALAGKVRLGELMRTLRTGAIIEEALPQEPHFYLMVLAVEPARQGRGIGSRMLRACCAEADAEGVAAALETSKPSNLPFYRRHGFEETHTHHIDGSPPMWSMVRAPR